LISKTLAFDVRKARKVLEKLKENQRKDGG
jgi:hypothetical protein